MIKKSFSLSPLLTTTAALVASFSLFSIAQGAGLVPCEGLSCNWCDLLQLFKNVLDFMMKIVIPLGAIMIVYGGFMILTAGGSAQRVSKGREAVTAAVIGIAIALCAWLIIDTIIKEFATGWSSVKGLGFWNKLQCSTSASSGLQNTTNY